MSGIELPERALVNPGLQVGGVTFQVVDPWGRDLSFHAEPVASTWSIAEITPGAAALDHIVMRLILEPPAMSFLQTGEPPEVLPVACQGGWDRRIGGILDPSILELMLPGGVPTRFNRVADRMGMLAGDPITWPETPPDRRTGLDFTDSLLLTLARVARFYDRRGVEYSQPHPRLRRYFLEEQFRQNAEQVSLLAVFGHITVDAPA